MAKDLVGKKKKVVNREAFLTVYRHPDAYVSPGALISSGYVIGGGLTGQTWVESPGEGSLAANIPRTILFGGTYTPILGAEVDALRVCLGKNWDHRIRDPSLDMASPQGAAAAIANESPTEKVFDNNWGALKMFWGKPLTMEMCDEPSEIPDSFGISTFEKIVVSCRTGHTVENYGHRLLAWLRPGPTTAARRLGIFYKNWSCRRKWGGV